MLVQDSQGQVISSLSARIQIVNELHAASQKESSRLRERLRILRASFGHAADDDNEGEGTEIQDGPQGLELGLHEQLFSQV